MADLDTKRLAVVMAQAAAGVQTAAITLYQEFGLHVARAMRRHLAELGVRDVDRDDLHGLTIDACIVLYDHARGWRPDGGALPWVWAERRLRQLAVRHVGQWSDPIDERTMPLPAPPLAGASDDPDELELLGTLARERSDVAAYASALGAAATSTRNQQVLLAYKVQASLGDRAPATTIGRRFGMTPRPPSARSSSGRTTASPSIGTHRHPTRWPRREPRRAQAGRGGGGAAAPPDGGVGARRGADAPPALVPPSSPRRHSREVPRG